MGPQESQCKDLQIGAKNTKIPHFDNISNSDPEKRSYALAEINKNPMGLGYLRKWQPTCACVLGQSSVKKSNKTYCLICEIRAYIADNTTNKLYTWELGVGRAKGSFFSSFFFWLWHFNKHLAGRNQRSQAAEEPKRTPHQETT